MIITARRKKADKRKPGSSKGGGGHERTGLNQASYKGGNDVDCNFSQLKWDLL